MTDTSKDLAFAVDRARYRLEGGFVRDPDNHFFELPRLLSEFGVNQARPMLEGWFRRNEHDLDQAFDAARFRGFLRAERARDPDNFSTAPLLRVIEGGRRSERNSGTSAEGPRKDQQ